MNRSQKSLVRLALAIHGRLRRANSSGRLIELPSGAWQRAADLVRQIRCAELHGWHLAAAKLRDDLGNSLMSLQAPLVQLERILANTFWNPYQARPADIYEDLLLLDEQFAAMSFDREAQQLSVTTEPITLENRYLGPFEIRLDLRRLASDGPYRAIALDPHPAASREGVTHPHVLDEVLCEGDGRTAIRQALAQGRLLDFFQLMVNLLRTYNHASPFVDLALWDGESCGDCGETVTADEQYICERCEDTVCGDCQVACDDCAGSFCNQCITKCDHCHDASCGRCLQPCSSCDRVVCSGCLDHERCPHCHEHDDSQNLAPRAETVRVEVHADGLGQAAVPA
jgi:hypothetical protein